MTIALQLAINILIPTALFGLVAAGFSIFYAVSRVQHMAIGASVGAAGYTLYALLARGFSLPLSSLAALAASVGVGIICNAAVYERLQGRRWFSSLVALISSVMLLLALQSLLLIFFGSQPKSVMLPTASERFEFLGVSITRHEVIAVPLALLVVGAFYVYLKRSRLGIAIRAVSDNSEVSEIIGVSARRIRYITMVLVSLVAGVAGILIAIEYNLEPYASNLLAIKAYGRTIIGGIGSIPGVILSGLIIDSAENLGAFYISSSYKELFSFVLVFLFLLLRPHGILGDKKE